MEPSWDGVTTVEFSGEVPSSTLRWIAWRTPVACRPPTIDGQCCIPLSPRAICAPGALLLYRIPRVVVGESRTFRGPQEHLRSRGVEVEIVDDPTCVELMEGFIAARPELWNEDIGE